MQEHQFDILMDILERIRCGIIDVESEVAALKDHGTPTEQTGNMPRVDIRADKCQVCINATSFVCAWCEGFNKFKGREQSPVG